MAKAKSNENVMVQSVNELVGKKVAVYYNLHTHTWSVVDKSINRVVLHTNHIELADVKFSVGQKGRERVLREQKKNVHAKVHGVVVADNSVNLVNDVEVTYNPYKYTSFVDRSTEKPVKKANSVVMDYRKVFAM